MADRLTTIIDIQTGESVKNTDALSGAEARFKKELAEVTRRLAEQEKAHADLLAKLKATGKGTEDATAKLDRMIRSEQLAAKIAKEHGTSVQAARRVVSAFGKDLDRAGKEAAEYARALDHAQKETQELTRAQRAAATGGRGLLSSVNDLRAGMFALAGGLGIAAVTNQAREAVGALMKMEAAQRTLNKATGGEGAAAMAFVRSEADRLGLSLGSTAEEFGKLSAAALGTKLEGEGVRDIFSAVSEVGATLSLSAQDQEGALKALGQMMSKGTVQAEELRGQLGERIPGAFQIMARGLGVTTQELGKMLETGQVLAEDALPKFAAELRRAFGTDAEQRIESTAATLARFETTVFELRSKTAELALGAGGLKDWADLMNALLTALTRGSAAVDGQTQKVGILSEGLRSFAVVVYGAIKAQQALNKIQEAFGLQTVEFETWTDKRQKAMDAALVEQQRWTDETKKTTIEEERMAAALKGSATAIATIAEAEKQRQEDLKKGAALTESLRTAQQNLDREMAEAERLYRAGAISLDTLTEARKRYDAASQQLRTQQFVELRDRIADAKQELLDLAALEEVDIRIRLDLEKLDLDEIMEGIQGQTGTADPFGLFNVDEIVSSYDGIRKSTEEQLRQLDTLAGSFDLIAFAFEDIGGSMGQLIAQLARAARSISSSIGDIQAGGAQGGALGALGVVGGVIGIFSQVYSLAQGMLADAKAKRFGLPITAQVTGGQFRAQAVGTGAVSDAQALQTVAAWRAAINDFREAVGGLLVDLPEIATRVRNDGKEVELLVGGVVFGIFDSLEEAFEAGLRIAVGQANIEGIGPTVAAALARTSASTMDELLKLLPVLRELDDVAAGLTAGYSRAKTAEDAFRTSLDIEAEKLLAHGAALADVVAWRQREIDAQQELLRASGNALAGVSTSFGKLQEWMDSVKAFNDAQGQEAARLAALTEAAERAANPQPDIFTGGGGPVGGAGGGNQPTPGGGGDGGAGGGLGSTKVALRGVAQAAEDTAAATRELTAAYVKQVREAVRLQAQAALFSELADFAEKYNVQLTGAGDLRAKIAELEFRGAQIRIALLVEELALNAQLLGLTTAQINQYRLWAQQVTGATFRGLAAGGSGGRAQERKQAEEEAKQAAADFNEQVTLMARQLAGASDAEIAHADALAELAEKGRAAKMSAEEVSAAVAMLAELQLRELAADWTAAAEDLGKVDLKRQFEAIKKKAEEDLATAMASAGDNPEAYAALVETIKAGVDAEMRELGQGALSGGRFGLRREARETAREIRFLMNHLEELGLTANQVAQNVKDSVVPELLGIIKAEAQRTGDLEAYNAAVAEEARLERILTRIRLEGLYLELQAANAVTPAIQEMFDTARQLLDMPTAPVDPTNPFRGWTVQAGADNAPRAGAGGTGPGGPQGETTADIIARLQRDAATDLERLEMDFQALLQSIADSTGTAAEKALALALAEEELARKRQEIQDRQLAGLLDLAKELEAEIIASKAPKAQIEAKQAAFQAAAAGVDINDEASIRAFEEAARDYLDAARGYGELVGSDVIYATARDAVAQILASFGIGSGANPPIPQGFGQPPGLGPPGLGPPSFLPPTAPAPIIVNAPPGQAANIGALSREIASLRSEVIDFKRVAEANFRAWIPARASVELTGNYIRRQGG